MLLPSYVRHAKPDFYLMDIEEEEDDSAELPIMKLNELGKLDETYIMVRNVSK